MINVTDLEREVKTLNAKISQQESELEGERKEKETAFKKIKALEEELEEMSKAQTDVAEKVQKNEDLEEQLEKLQVTAENLEDSIQREKAEFRQENLKLKE